MSVWVEGEEERAGGRETGGWERQRVWWRPDRVRFFRTHRMLLYSVTESGETWSLEAAGAEPGMWQVLKRILIRAECNCDPGRKREAGADGCMTESRDLGPSCCRAIKTTQGNLSIFCSPFVQDYVQHLTTCQALHSLPSLSHRSKYFSFLADSYWFCCQYKSYLQSS